MSPFIFTLVKNNADADLNTHSLFGFMFLIGYSSQFENLIRKINDFFQCYCVANPSHPSLLVKGLLLLFLTSVDVSSLKMDGHLQLAKIPLVPALWGKCVLSSTHPYSAA